MNERKPHENHRRYLNKRTVKAMAESGKPIAKLTDSQKKTPSQRKSDCMKRKLRNRDGRKCPRDFQEPKVLE